MTPEQLQEIADEIDGVTETLTRNSGEDPAQVAWDMLHARQADMTPDDFETVKRLLGF